MSIEIKRNRYLAITMIGLISVGYGEPNNKDEKSNDLIKKIRSIKFEDGIYEYFEKAKSRKSIYNDFYPNGSCLEVASFYIKDFAYTNYNEFIEFIASTGIQGFDDEFYSWAHRLPEVLDKITMYKEYPFIMEQYNIILDKRLLEHKNMIKDTSSIIRQFTKEPYNIVFSPIPIYPYSVDYVKQGTTITVISDRPDEMSILHEFLHTYVGKYRAIIKQNINDHDFGKYVDVKKALDIGYMWDDSDDSKVHAVEEGIVRALSVYLSNIDRIKKEYIIKMNDDYGFYFISRAYDELKGKQITDKMLEELIINIIK